METASSQSACLGKQKDPGLILGTTCHARAAPGTLSRSPRSSIVMHAYNLSTGESENRRVIMNSSCIVKPCAKYVNFKNKQIIQR